MDQDQTPIVEGSPHLETWTSEAPIRVVLTLRNGCTVSYGLTRQAAQELHRKLAEYLR